LADGSGQVERAILVHLDFSGETRVEDGVEELRELVRSAGAESVAVIRGARRAPDARYCVGRGKAEQIAAEVSAHAADVVIVDHFLSPAQERNLERLVGCRVLDRVALILDIFAQRARTFEGKLQVELAQLRHLATRLVRGWTHLERQKGGIGLRGPGEKQLETDRRLIAERIRRINNRLAAVRRRRGLSRRARERAGAPVVSLVGYTNAGKSTLFNALTGARVASADRLFATLDPTLRRLALPGGPDAILADTVGFIRNLPHELVAAFRATLEEVAGATLILHVIDSAAPGHEAHEAQVEAVLEAIGASAVPRIDVYNKIDLAGDAGAGDTEFAYAVAPAAQRRARAFVSARTGQGLESLTRLVASALRAGMVRRRVSLPATAGRLRARLHALRAVAGEVPGDGGGWVIDLDIGAAPFDDLCRDEGLDRWLTSGTRDRGYDRALPSRGHTG